MILSGNTISPGISHGVARVYDMRSTLALAQDIPRHGSIDDEVDRLQGAVLRACGELERLQGQLSNHLSISDAGIFQSHIGLLNDSKFIQQIELQITDHSCSAEAAVARTISQLHTGFAAHHSDLLQDKAADILDVGRRLLHCLSEHLRVDIELQEAEILVAGSLTPSELVRGAHQKVAAIVTETCGPKSHTAILARGLGIPMVTGVRGACRLIPEAAEIFVDASAGCVVCDPTEDEHAIVQTILVREQAAAADAELPPELPITLDGVQIKLLLNISDSIEAAAVQRLHAGGVGLFRTEFFYMDRPWWPTEDESYAIYAQVAKLIGDAELNIRLVDFGAEKRPAYADIPTHRNPSLGLRGLRLLLQREDILRPQVLALARVARERPLTVLLPMLDTLDSLQRLTALLCKYLGCERREQLPFRLGTMIEVPSAALLIDDLLPHLDAVALGLNDLTQYLLAADRDDASVDRYHDAMQPAVLRLVARVIAAANAASKDVTVCGELAGDPNLTALLLALGLRRISLSRSNYLEVTNIIRHLQLREIAGAADEILRLTSGQEVREFVTRHFTCPLALPRP